MQTNNKTPYAYFCVTNNESELPCTPIFTSITQFASYIGYKPRTLYRVLKDQREANVKAKHDMFEKFRIRRIKLEPNPTLYKCTICDTVFVPIDSTDIFCCDDCKQFFINAVTDNTALFKSNDAAVHSVAETASIHHMSYGKWVNYCDLHKLNPRTGTATIPVIPF